MSKRSFNAKGMRLVKPLELVQNDVRDSMTISLRGGYNYQVNIINDYSRYEYVYLMHCKSETFDKIKEFCVEVEKQLSLTLKKL